jgi:pimeloyl-ACP methyl ester carboxylesterase
VPPIAPPLLARATDEIEALARGLDRDFAIVGHSLGVPLALEVAARLRERARGVVAVDGIPFHGLFVHRTSDAAMLHEHARSDRERRSLGTDGEFHARLARELRRQCRLESSFAAIAAEASASARDAVCDALGELTVLDARPALAAMSASLLLVLADWAKTPSEAGERFVAQYEGARDLRVEVIDGAAHFVMLDRPHAFMGVLEPLLRRCSE